MARSRAQVAREERRVAMFSKFRTLTLNLIPLVDVMVSLVFFTLLTHSTATVPVVPGVRLPESRVGPEAAERLTIGISSNPAVIVVGGRRVMTYQEAAAAQSSDPTQPLVIPQLLDVLRAKADSVRLREGGEAGGELRTQVAVQGDRSMRYDMLARVLQTARAAGFTKITLQVRREGADAMAAAPTEAD